MKASQYDWQGSSADSHCSFQGGTHLRGVQHVLDDALHVGPQALRLQVQQLHQARAHRLPDLCAGVVRQRKQARQIPALTCSLLYSYMMFVTSS